MITFCQKQYQHSCFWQFFAMENSNITTISDSIFTIFRFASRLIHRLILSCV